jgi:hypothetical protein
MMQRMEIGRGMPMQTFLQFIPLLLISLVIGIFMAVAASKVGRSPVLWFILGAIPVVNFFFIWIATWSVIIELYRKLKAMERPASRS